MQKSVKIFGGLTENIILNIIRVITENSKIWEK